MKTTDRGLKLAILMVSPSKNMMEGKGTKRYTEGGTAFLDILFIHSEVKPKQDTTLAVNFGKSEGVLRLWVRHCGHGWGYCGHEWRVLRPWMGHCGRKDGRGDCVTKSTVRPARISTPERRGKRSTTQRRGARARSYVRVDTTAHYLFPQSVITAVIRQEIRANAKLRRSANAHRAALKD